MNTRETIHLTESQVSELADGTLDTRERPVVLSHVEQCGECRGDVEETRALLARAHNARVDVTAPAELWPLVASATMHGDHGRSHRTMRRIRLLVVVAAALLAVSLVASLRARLRDRAEHPPPATVRGDGGPPTAPKAPPAPPAP